MASTTQPPYGRLLWGNDGDPRQGTWDMSLGKIVPPRLEEGPGSWRSLRGETRAYAPTYKRLSYHGQEEMPRTLRRRKLYESLGKMPWHITTDISDGPETGIMGLSVVSSFNALDVDDSIAIPGIPALFRQPTMPMSLVLDDHNHSQPKDAKVTYYFEPLVESVKRMSDSANLASADVVATCSTLRLIFTFFEAAQAAEGSPMSSDFARWLPHRFDLEWNPSGTLYIAPWADDPRFDHSLGHGKGFEKKTCSFAQDDPVIGRSSSHYQVVSYSLGGLQCLVQSEVDAYSCECGHAVMKRAEELSTPLKGVALRSARPESIYRGSLASRGKKTKLNSINSRPALSSKFEVLAMDDPGDMPGNASLPRPNLEPAISQGPRTKTAKAMEGGKLTIQEAGTLTPLLPSCSLEIKTMGEHSTMNLDNWAPQLYFSGRRQLFVAVHKKGRFEPADGHMLAGVDSWLEEWAGRDSTQSALASTAALLKAVQRKVSELNAVDGPSPSKQGRGLSLLLSYKDSDEGREGGRRRVPYARLHGRGDGVKLLP